MEYKCFRCGYIGKRKNHLMNHFKRKKICLPLLDNISIEKMCEKYNFQNLLKLYKNSTQTAPFSTQTALFSTQIAPFEKKKQHLNSTQIAPKSTQIAPKQHLNSTQIAPKIIKCEFCNKTFTRKTGLTKHLNCCKIKNKKLGKKKVDEKIKDDEKMKKNDKLENKKGELKKNEIDELKKEHEYLKDKIEDLLIELSKNTSAINNNITNNTTHHTNNNQKIINININNYGNENTEYLNKDYLNNLLNGAFSAIPKLIEKIHFNPNHPENHNIKITNKKEPYIKVRKNDKWELQDKKETLETLVDDKYYILEDHYSEINSDDISNHTKEIMEKFRSKFGDDKELQKEIQKKSEIIILNNS